MIFLSPEGMIADHNEAGRKYIEDCQQFCTSQGMQPFEYVLTPRYKGTACLLQQLRCGNECDDDYDATINVDDDDNEDGVLLSVVLLFVRDGKLMNCKLLEPTREVADIYDLLEGISGNTIDVYIIVRRIPVAQGSNTFDAKKALMAEYVWKDAVCAEYEAKLQKERESSIHDVTLPGFTQLHVPASRLLCSVGGHLVLISALCWSIGLTAAHVMKMFSTMVACMAVLHYIGAQLGPGSMESIPFETAIKDMVIGGIKFKESFSQKKRQSSEKEDMEPCLKDVHDGEDVELVAEVQ